MIRTGLLIAFSAMFLPCSNMVTGIIAGCGALVFFWGVRRSVR